MPLPTHAINFTPSSSENEYEDDIDDDELIYQVDACKKHTGTADEAPHSNNETNSLYVSVFDVSDAPMIKHAAAANKTTFKAATYMSNKPNFLWNTHSEMCIVNNYNATNSPMHESKNMHSGSSSGTVGASLPTAAFERPHNEDCTTYIQGFTHQGANSKFICKESCDGGMQFPIFSK